MLPTGRARDDSEAFDEPPLGFLHSGRARSDFFSQRGVSLEESSTGCAAAIPEPVTTIPAHAAPSTILFRL